MEFPDWVQVKEKTLYYNLFSLEEDLCYKLHGAIYRPDSFVLMMLRHCVNLKAIRDNSTSLNRIAADKSHRVIVALVIVYFFKLEPSLRLL